MKRYRMIAALGAFLLFILLKLAFPGLATGLREKLHLAPDAPKDAMPVAAEEISEAFLRSGRACIYSVSSYNVDREISNCTLLITLTAPDGNCYRYASGWIYMPEYMEKDEWYVTMDEAGLLNMLNNDGYPEGTYSMAMYIDGKLADSFSFTLIK